MPGVKSYIVKHRRIIYLLLIHSIFLFNNNSVSKAFGKPVSNFIQNNDNNGTEFWFSPILYYYESNLRPAIYKIYVQTAGTANVTIEINNKGYKSTQTIVMNHPGIWNLSDTLAQCRLSYSSDSLNHFYQYFDIPSQTFGNSAIHITSDNKISVFVLMNYKWASEAMALIPSENLGNEYFISSYRTIGLYFPTYAFPSIATITATRDSTLIKIKI